MQQALVVSFGRGLREVEVGPLVEGVGRLIRLDGRPVEGGHSYHATEPVPITQADGGSPWSCY